MEAATWNGPNIQRTSTRLGLRTEASGRFEKQLQPEQALEGQAVATKLMVELCGARPVGGTIDVGGPGPAPRTLRLRDARTRAAARRAGAARRRRADPRRARLRRGRRGRRARRDRAAWRRADVEREADLIEEVARLWGLDRLPATLPSRRGAVGRLAPEQRLRRRAEDALVGAGLLGGGRLELHLARGGAAGSALAGDAVVLENPMSEDHSVMRTTLLGSLLDALRRNRSRGFEDVRLFEYGAVYLPRAGSRLLGRRPATRGTRRPTRRCRSSARTWPRCSPAARGRRAGAIPTPPRVDFFAAKAVLEALMRALRVDWRVEAGADEPFLHPRRGATRARRRGRAGWLGELHPSVAAAWDLDGAAGFELDLGPLAAAADAVPRYEDLTSFPAVRQDLAVVVADDVPAARVLDVDPRRRRRAAARRRGVRRLPRRAGRRGRARRWRSGSSSAPPTAR